MSPTTVVHQPDSHPHTLELTGQTFLNYIETTDYYLEERSHEKSSM